MGPNASRTIFDLGIISIAVVIALIVGAGTGYLVGNSPLTSLMEERDSLEAEYDSLDLAFQGLEVELASIQESLVEERGANALLQESVIELGNRIEVLEDEIDELLGPDSEPEPDPSPLPPSKRYVGSINSDKYHLPSCYWAGQINPENEIWFTSKSDAESHGYVPCKVCKP